MKIKELEEALRIERLDHDDFFDAVIEFRNEFKQHPNAPILQAAQTMLKLMKAREKAIGGEWYEDSHRPDQATIKVKNGTQLAHQNYRKCTNPTVCVLAANLVHTNDEKKSSAQFITQAANLTREST